jgi:NADH-quinone oxidoreductase subunit L
MISNLPQAEALVLQPATGIFTFIWLLVALPLIGAFLILTFGKYLKNSAPYLAIGLSSASFVLGFTMFLQMLARPESQRGFVSSVYQWISSGDLNVSFGLQLDQLSIAFVLLITFVGTMIHIYSLGYMEHDENRGRFFGYLNLFVAAMLLLVLADNYLLLYVGWEGVGLASYLLIGFWQSKHSAATAAKKAFVVNRVGDFGLSLAIMTMFLAFGSFSFSVVSSNYWIVITTCCRWKERAISAAVLVIRRNGRPNSGFSINSRSNHGYRGCLFNCSLGKYF